MTRYIIHKCHRWCLMPPAKGTAKSLRNTR